MSGAVARPKTTAAKSAGNQTNSFKITEFKHIEKEAETLCNNSYCAVFQMAATSTRHKNHIFHPHTHARYACIYK